MEPGQADCCQRGSRSCAGSGAVGPCGPGRRISGCPPDRRPRAARRARGAEGSHSAWRSPQGGLGAEHLCMKLAVRGEYYLSPALPSTCVCLRVSACAHTCSGYLGIGGPVCQTQCRSVTSGRLPW